MIPSLSGDVAEAEITVFAEKMRRVLVGADEFSDRWARLQKRWATRPKDASACGAKLRRAYEEATGTIIGCD